MPEWSEVEKVIEIIRPAMQADGGDIRLVEVDSDTGVVKVELLGACGDCPVSEQDLKLGVERIMIQRVPGVTAVVNAALVDALPPVSETTFKLKGFGK
ncbi:MAG: NifU family protein [Actinobacteria bacterium]|nr:NifU family protein [Actinomycetota bacterium]